MDQNSTNGSEPDKRNWRERLGIGAKEMPKLSDEFRDASAGSDARSAPPGAQPVTKPAPMAPRAPRPAVSASSTEPRPAAAPPPRATPRTPDNAAQEALADKLRAQRVAAEKLAEQRVQAARERAEGKSPQADQPPTGQRPGSAAPRMPPSAPPKPRAAVPPPPPGSRPKFSFADEPPSPRDMRGAGDAAASRPGYPGGAGAPLSPPRPALGGGQPPFLRPSAAGARPQPPYRPVDPSANYGPPPRLQPPPGRPGFGADTAAPGYPAARGAPRRPPPALESFPRQADQREYPDNDFDDGRQPPRLGRPTRSRARDDDDEVFEDDGTSRQRASARDYQAAYGEGEDTFAEDQRRSGGPWLLLLALLAAALVTGGVVWYYNSGMKDVAGPGTGAGDVPVVSAPEDPAKVAPEAPAAGAEQPAAQRKQIYDRIVGDQEVLGGQIETTEEIPVPPAAAQPAGDVAPATGVNPIPAPDAAIQGTGEGLPSVDEPPPLPLPPADQEGNLGQSSTERIAATAAEVEQGVTALPSLPVPETSDTTTTSSVALLPPPPEPAASEAAVVPETAPAARQASQPEQEVEAVEPPPPPPPKKKAAEKKKPPEENLGAEPVVLVPPSEDFLPGAETASSAPITAPEEAAPAPEKKPRSIMDLFRGSGRDEAPEAQAQPETRVAAVEPAQPAAPARSASASQPATGSGFLVQLSSFRSAADARKEYARLSSLYPSVVGGLPEQIRETSVGGSTRYQLGLGPLPSRSDATRVCSALITAGESDCIVRGR